MVGDEVHNASPTCSEHYHSVQQPLAHWISKHETSRLSIQSNHLNNRRLRYWHIPCFDLSFPWKHLSRTSSPKMIKANQSKMCVVWPLGHLVCIWRHIWNVEQIILKDVPPPSWMLQELFRIQNSACKSCFIQDSWLVPVWRVLDRTMRGQQT